MTVSPIETYPSTDEEVLAINRIIFSSLYKDESGEVVPDNRASTSSYSSRRSIFEPMPNEKRDLGAASVLDKSLPKPDLYKISKKISELKFPSTTANYVKFSDIVDRFSWNSACFRLKFE